MWTHIDVKRENEERKEMRIYEYSKVSPRESLSNF